MALGNNSTSMDGLLKELYSKDAVQEACLKRSPLVGMVAKDEKASGRHYIFDIHHGTGQSISNNFTTSLAMAGLTSELNAQFQVSLRENFQNASVSNQVIAQTKNAPGAFMKAVQQIVDAQIESFAKHVGIQMYGTGSGALGQISTGTTIASSTLKLANVKDTLRFEVGMALDVAAAEATGNVRAYGSAAHGLYVSAVDPIAGQITIATTPAPGGTPVNMNDATDGIPAIAQGDYIFQAGCRNQQIQGIGAWIPYGGPASNDSFCGVNRFSNPVRLAGSWLDGTAGSTRSSILEDGMAQLGDMGGECTHVLTSFKAFSELSKELGSKAVLTNEKVSAQIGYDGIKVAGPGGFVNIMPDRSCPSDRMFCINIDTWKLVSVDPIVHLWDEDGKVWLRDPSAAGMAVRLYSLGNLVCEEPRSNLVIKITP